MEKVRTLDMKGADGYAVTEEDLVLRAVAEDGLEGELLFSGLEGINMRTLLTHGTLYPNSDYIYACVCPGTNEDELVNIGPIDFAETNHKEPVLAVYDRDKFKREVLEKWQFIGPGKMADALLKVYKLEF
jgi:hypothetical protein